jgi:ABC-type transporter Mla subunit MlaD
MRSMFKRLKSGEITVEEIHSYAKMLENGNSSKQDLSSTIESLKNVLSIADRVDEELKTILSSLAK